MKTDGIKTQWASVRMASHGQSMVCVKVANSLKCLFFESSEQFKAAVKSKRICVKNWIVSIPDNCAITKSAILPASDLSEAYKMLEFELPSWLPLPPEELVYGCSATERKGDLVGVQVTIAKIGILRGILADYEAIGIKPAKVLIDSIAAESWFNRDKKTSGPEIDLLLDGDRCLVLSGSNGKRCLHSEVILENSDILANRQQITEEVSMLAEENMSVDQELPSLKIGARKEIWSDLDGWFGECCKPIKFVELPELLAYDGSHSADKQYLYDAAIAQGLVLSLQDPDLAFLNLLPGNLVRKAEKKKLILNCAVTAALSASLIFFLWLSFAAMNWRTEWACRKITEKIAPIKDIAADVESKRQRVKAIQNQLSNRDQVGRIFEQLYKYSPAEISISGLGYVSKSDSATLNIKGQADTLSNALEYSYAMQESDLLKDMQVTNAQQVAAPGGSVVEFRADCVLNQR